MYLAGVYLDSHGQLEFPEYFDIWQCMPPLPLRTTSMAQTSVTSHTSLIASSRQPLPSTHNRPIIRTSQVQSVRLTAVVAPTAVTKPASLFKLRARPPTGAPQRSTAEDKIMQNQSKRRRLHEAEDVKFPTEDNQVGRAPAGSVVICFFGARASVRRLFF
jgi:hypothetical protein